ncbi:Uma2 family endonuclease [Nostocaceae cyanobacterium CENA369]|uniref:Uma2 family endonuclease n=1 Tax=Dendronalium phyllosphericum CENA369 TaxID=1725256 RepID=A0A8J7IKR2_9NOST|nr:Uma2 family endonuclease [Dendronalium phyllosphericum]MBH8576437.1 Uma2 family endonuclease [Dendronalium phyllosphericum CENA369]
MTSLLPSSQSTEVFYPSSDGEPLAESYVHLYALLVTLEVLRQYLQGQQATVLSNQFLYYAQGFPKLRVAPDVMVIFDVAPGGRDNYKIWEEGQVPVVIFEMTSEGTRNQHTGFKKTLYEQLGVLEYWLFDPKGEWIKEKLQGYRLRNEVYEPITDNRCEPLELRLQIEGQLISFYREDTGDKLLIPEELAQALKEERLAREQAQEQARQAQSQVEKLKEQLRSLGVNPDTI